MNAHSIVAGIVALIGVGFIVSGASSLGSSPVPGYLAVIGGVLMAAGGVITIVRGRASTRGAEDAHSRAQM